MLKDVGKLENRVGSVPKLEIYDGSTDTQVELQTNASATAFGAILFQKCTGAKHFYPIALLE